MRRMKIHNNKMIKRSLIIHINLNLKITIYKGEHKMMLMMMMLTMMMIIMIAMKYKKAKKSNKQKRRAHKSILIHLLVIKMIFSDKLLREMKNQGPSNNNLYF